MCSLDFKLHIFYLEVFIMKRLVKPMAVLLTLILVMFVSVNVFAYNTGDDYPSQYKNRGISTVVDEWNFYNR